MTKKVQYIYLIPALTVVFFTLLSFTDFFRGLEYKVHDFLLHVKPSIPENKSLLLIEIDDTAIEEVGTFPWSRDKMVPGLTYMKEFGAKYVVFDIEYRDNSPSGVDKRYLNQYIPKLTNSEFAQINQRMGDLFAALSSGNIRLKDAGDFVEQLAALNNGARDAILDNINKIEIDNDTYLGQGAHLFASAFFTVNMLPFAGPAKTDDRIEYAQTHIALPSEKIQVQDDFIKAAVDIRPAILPILSQAKGAGFPNVVIDSDGVRRRIDLLRKYDNKYYAQLAFAALYDWLGRPDIVIKQGHIILKNAVTPDGEAKNIIIPLDEDNKMVINWPRKTYINSFRHYQYILFLHFLKEEQSLISNFEVLNQSGYFTGLGDSDALLGKYQRAEEIKNAVLNGDDPTLMNEYITLRQELFTEMQTFLNQQHLDNVLAYFDSEIAAAGTGTLADQYQAIKKDFKDFYSKTLAQYAEYMEFRETGFKTFKDAFCIIGLIGTSTTDIGVTPFEKEYMNVGTHASVVNTILEGYFIDEIHWWFSFILALALAMLLTFFIRDLEPMPSIITGSSVVVALLLAGAGVFVFTGNYLNMLSPVFAVFFSFIIISFIKLFKIGKDKAFIKNAFSHYLDNEVIDQLIINPDKLELGGDKKVLSAMFTDIKGFSTVSEDIDPTDLVKLLNHYLTEMSNIILELKGTLDKYEGDAIISFFGAPIHFDDHASRACLAAINMKRMEKIINDHVLQHNLSPAPLLTRIGINTGEMVVGNMGSIKKMDYTIMGHAVNLAARLEGVNKLYGTWVLISENTYNSGGNIYATRRLDRVRVVNIKNPVRIYELIDRKENLDQDTNKMLEIFDQALTDFEAMNWDAAQKGFKDILKFMPEDGPSKVFADRCQKFRRNPPSANWDGVFNLTMK